MPVPKSINTGISYDSSYEQWDAAAQAGLDLWRWEQGEYPRPFMIRVIAFGRLRNMVHQHTEAALARAAEREAKKK